MYPEGHGTTITVSGPSAGLEGAARPEHFDGVATIVAKLLLAVRPDRAVFGRKDAQQVAVVRRLMADLHLDDIELVVAPIFREPDGLAMSSRNAYLGPEDREAATALSRGLRAAEALVQEGERDAARVAAAARAVIEAEPRCALEYAAVVHPDTFVPLDTLEGPALLAVAARVGPARLIDNVLLPTRPRRAANVPLRTRTMMKSKIHRATVTDADLNYVGSITVDTDLLEAADILPYEQVVVLNINTGARFETYAIEGPAGRGDICLNGAAARLAQPGDLVIVLTYAQYDAADLEGFEPIVVHVDSQNTQVDVSPALEGVPAHVGGAVAMNSHLSADDIRARKGGVRLAMLTAYDYPTAMALEAAGVDILLVGDSLGEVELGFPTTRDVTLAMMAHHVRAVRNGAPDTHVCGDLSAGTYRTPEEAVESAPRRWWPPAPTR